MCLNDDNNILDKDVVLNTLFSSIVIFMKLIIYKTVFLHFMFLMAIGIIITSTYKYVVST